MIIEKFEFVILYLVDVVGIVCFFKQKTAYEMRISGWSSDVCASDLTTPGTLTLKAEVDNHRHTLWPGAFVSVGLTLSIDPDALLVPETAVQQIGRASCRERVCQYV